MMNALLVRFSARHIGAHLKHIPLRHRMAAALALCALGGVLYWITREEAYWKLVEFSSAPFVDKVLFELGIGEEL